MYILLFKNIQVAVLLFVVLGSLFPDIDTPFSKLGRLNPLSFIMKHRGFTHTTLCLVISSCVIATITNNLAYTTAFGFGYLLHLLADTLTPMGIMWAYPESKKYYTFSKKENLRGLEGIILGTCLLYLLKGKII